MPLSLERVYEDELSVLAPDRTAHSVAVGEKAARSATLVPAWMRSELVAAAVLHDIGYGHPVTGFHPLDGARYLAAHGYSALVCHLVIHHSASTMEAEERGINLSVYSDFRTEQDVSRAHAVLWWADMTTGPQGQDLAVETRLDEICSRYGPDHLVTRFITRARPVLLSAGQSPEGSIQVPV